MYVAITRAKEKLWLTRSKSRYLYGHREPTMRSRFIRELEDELEIPAESERFSGYGYGARYSGAYGAGRTSYGAGRGGYSSGYGAGYGSSYSGMGASYYGNNSYGGRAAQSVPSDNARSTQGAQELPTFGSGSRPAASAGVRFGNAGKTAAPTQPRKDTSRFAVGTRVRHARFGDGVITAMRGAGGNVIVTVRFEQAGNKDLAAALAPLEILE